MKVFYKIYDSKMASREKLFKAATEFANKIGPDDLINITHSEDRDNIVITIWYWALEEIKDDRQGRKIGERPASRPVADTAKNGSTSSENSGSARELEKSVMRRELDRAAAEKELTESGHTVPTPIQEIVLEPIQPPPDPLEDSW